MNLLGLAYTVPSVAVLSVNRDLFRVFLYEPGAISSLKLFLQAGDARKPVVLVKSINELKGILQSDADMTSVVVILFETHKVLSLISGIYILDVDVDGEFQYVRHSDLHITLSSEDYRPVDIKEALNNNKTITGDISFRELVAVIEKYYDDNDVKSNDFAKHACSYLVGLINKKSWVELVRKPALSAGVTVESLAELEKFIDTSKPADLLWHSFYMFTQQNMTLAAVTDTHNIDQYDFDFLCKHLNAEQGTRYDFVAPPPVEAAKKPKKAKKKSEPKNKAKEAKSE